MRKTAEWMKDGWIDKWIVYVLLAMFHSGTSVTKSGTDGSPGLASTQGTKWLATTGPDGPRLSVLFLPLNRWWMKNKKDRSKGFRRKMVKQQDRRTIFRLQCEEKQIE